MIEQYSAQQAQQWLSLRIHALRAEKQAIRTKG